MAVKTNAKPAKQTEPAKDAAMVEVADGATEQTVTPGRAEADAQGEGKTPGVPATLIIQADGKEQVFDVELHYGEQARGGKVFCLPPVLTFEGTMTCDPETVRRFDKAVRGLFASILADAGVLVRKEGANLPPAGDDILAVHMREKDTALVTTDGRKFLLVDSGAINEA